MAGASFLVFGTFSVIFYVLNVTTFLDFNVNGLVWCIGWASVFDEDAYGALALVVGETHSPCA